LGLTVTEREFAISPRDVRVASPGTTAIAIRNNGTVEHALEVKGPTGDVRTAAIAPGASAQLKVDLSKSGSYTWYCPIDGHRARGMSGHIVVAGGGSSGGGSSGGGSSGGGSSYP
jgi:uncharacterized cupredoxin-like copper-binding protein